MIDWTDCPLVQCDPRFVSGKPALRGEPRVLVEPLVESADLGMKPEEIAEAYDVPTETVRSLLAYAESHRVAPSPV